MADKDAIREAAEKIYKLYPPAARTWEGSPIISDIESVIRAEVERVAKIYEEYLKGKESLLIAYRIGDQKRADKALNQIEKWQPKIDRIRQGGES